MTTDGVATRASLGPVIVMNSVSATLSITSVGTRGMTVESSSHSGPSVSRSGHCEFGLVAAAAFTSSSPFSTSSATTAS